MGGVHGRLHDGQCGESWYVPHVRLRLLHDKQLSIPPLIDLKAAWEVLREIEMFEATSPLE